jgi:hypothetical protein
MHQIEHSWDETIYVSEGTGLESTTLEINHARFDSLAQERLLEKTC